jgi:hypothetical protein
MEEPDFSQLLMLTIQQLWQYVSMQMHGKEPEQTGFLRPLENEIIPLQASCKLADQLWGKRPAGGVN